MMWNNQEKFLSLILPKVLILQNKSTCGDIHDGSKDEQIHCCKSVLSNSVASRHVGLLFTQNVANVTEKLNF